MYLGRVVELTLDAGALRQAGPSLYPGPDVGGTGARSRAAQPAHRAGRRAAEPGSPPPGCPFHPRCPQAMERCKSEVPVLQDIGGVSARRTTSAVICIEGPASSTTASSTAAPVTRPSRRSAQGAVGVGERIGLDGRADRHLGARARNSRRRGASGWRPRRSRAPARGCRREAGDRAHMDAGADDAPAGPDARARPPAPASRPARR